MHKLLLNSVFLGNPACTMQLRGVLPQPALAQRGGHQEEGEGHDHRGDQGRRRRRRTQRTRAAQLLNCRHKLSVAVWWMEKIVFLGGAGRLCCLKKFNLT